MNKEKTAIQILIENLDARSANDPPDALMYALETVKIEAKVLLQKEQEQIEKAYAQGVEDCLIALKTEKSISQNDYYQSKYGGEE